MNVIVSNKYQNMLATLDIDVIKSITGEYDADEIVSMFKNFYCNRIIIDLTAIKDYANISNVQKISIGLETDKLIFLLPPTPESSSSAFLSKLISMGIYNFTTDGDGIKYLLDHPNAYKDVAHYQQLNDMSTTVNNVVISGVKVLGIENVTESAGATSLIYMIKKHLEDKYGIKVAVLEVNKRDFSYFEVKDYYPTTKENLSGDIAKYKSYDVLLVDLNNTPDTGVCGDVLYLVEPSTIKLNKLMRTNPKILKDLQNKKVILNKSLLNSKDVAEFEREANLKVYFNLKPLDERVENSDIDDLLAKLGMIQRTEEEPKEEGGGFLGLFRK